VKIDIYFGVFLCLTVYTCRQYMQMITVVIEVNFQKHHLTFLSIGKTYAFHFLCITLTCSIIKL